jgi:uncharacterized protein YbjT (DUF2867 family)
MNAMAAMHWPDRAHRPRLATTKRRTEPRRTAHAPAATRGAQEQEHVMTFVITGVSGNTGGVVANTLLDAGHAVRVVVRERSKADALAARGAEVSVADLGDADALATALRGASGAYLLIPPNGAAPDVRAYQHRLLDAIATAVERARVPHVVLLSSVGAQHPAGTGPIAGLYAAEQRLAAIDGTRSSFVRAAYFMENLGGSLGMLEQGVLPSFTPGATAFDMVATRDIGKTAAGLLVEGPGTAKTQAIELRGPAKVSMNDVAATLSRIVGKPIAVSEAPLDAMVPTLTSFGMSADVAGLYREMTAAMLSGHVAFEGGHREVAGTTTVEAVLRAMLGKT